MILIAIIACEVAFWVAILAGLSARYLLRRRRLGLVLLALAPVIDAVLLILVAVDLLGGGTASWHHGLAALYIGVSIAYGHRMIAWADSAFARRFDGAPPRPKLYGAAYTRACWRDVGLTLVAAAIAAGIIGALVLVVDAPERTAALEGYLRILGIILAVDVIWAVSYTVWPRREPAAALEARS